MKTVIAEFTIKPEKLAESEAVIVEFVRNVHLNEPQTQYQAWQRAGTSSYIHMMNFVNDVAEVMHKNAPYTMRFIAHISQNCEHEPTFTEIMPVQL